MTDIIKLDNGVRIAVEKMPYVNSVAFGIWVKNGSRYETEAENGISHFIEHLLFKGTKKRTAKEIATEMDQIGGHINAFTSKEYTCYYSKALDKHFGKAVDVLADMFFNSNFDEEEIIKETNVIIEEIAMYEDSPEDLVMEEYHKAIYKGTSLARPILGTKETISKFRHDTFKEFMFKRYTPENIVISVAGNFDKDEVVRVVNEYFGSFDTDNEPNPKFESIYTPTIVKTEKDIEQLHMIMGLKSYGTGHDMMYNMSVIGALLGGGMSSRLFQKVREERGLCYSIYTQNISFTDVGSFLVYSALNKNNVNELFDVTLEELSNLKETILEKGLIQDKKEQLECSYLLGLESSINRMNAIGRSVILQDKIFSKEEILGKINKVNTETLNKCIDEVFKIDNLSISMTGNVENIDLKF